MKTRLLAGVATAAMMSAVPVARMHAGSRASGAAAGVAAPDCSALEGLALPNVTITEAVAASSAQGVTVPHCKVSGVIDKETRFTLLLPDTWNQSFVMGGGGGFVGEVQNQAVGSVNAGYATIGTDTGHRGTVITADWALNNPDRRINFGYLAVHRTAEIGKAIINAYYGSGASHSYFSGCSNGGRQAMMEAQRYPDDFDGIVAGAPALDFSGIALQFVRDAQITFPDPKNLATPLFTPANLKMLGAKVLEACDALDGVKDGVMEDPRRCHFDTAAIPACANDQPGPDCFTKAQHAAVRKLYEPTKTAAGIVRVGQPFGGEDEPAGWQQWTAGVDAQLLGASHVPSLHYAFGTEFFKYFIFNDPAWDYSKYSLVNGATDVAAVGKILNALNPDLDAFKKKGHKVVMWHGWSDPALSALASVQYYEQVEKRDPKVREYFRLFMLPGVLHCGGGPAPDRADWISVISDWVEQHHAPDRIVASKTAGGKPVRTRPLCLYPQHAVYNGSGSTDEAANFSCKR